MGKGRRWSGVEWNGWTRRHPAGAFRPLYKIVWRRLCRPHHLRRRLEVLLKPAQLDVFVQGNWPLMLGPWYLQLLEQCSVN